MIDTLFTDNRIWEYVGYLLGGATGALIVALGLWLVSKLGKDAVRLWTEARFIWQRYVPALIEQVDEPGDPIILFIDRYVPGQASGALAKALPAFFRALADALDEPVREVNLGESTK